MTLTWGKRVEKVDTAMRILDRLWPDFERLPKCDRQGCLDLAAFADSLLDEATVAWTLGRIAQATWKSTK